MKKDVIEKMIVQAEEKRYRAERNYQDSGYNRYYTTMVKNEELATVLRDALNSERHIEISKRLSSYIKQWAGVISEFPYYSPERKDEELKRIAFEIMIQAKFL